MNVDLSADIIDVRDIIEEFKALDASADPDDRGMRDALEMILGDLAGYGGDEQFEGNWYPATLIRDSYFKEYAQDFAEDVCSISHEWPYYCIDWNHAARELQMDYTSTDINGVTYWYR